MFRQVLVGIDERELGADALALARRLMADDAALTLAHVSTDDPRIYRAASAGFEQSERRHGTELLEEARLQSGMDAGVRYIASTSVGRGLHEVAEDVHADLLVVGSTRRSLVGRVLVGDDTRKALNSAPCAVAIAPSAYRESAAEFREVGVGYDESPESLHALAIAREIAAARGARLSAFEAISVPHYVLATSSAPADESIRDFVDEARARIAALGDIDAHAAYGHASEELALYSASLDLLVLGSRGYGPFGRLIHGSTSEVLARTARCPLLVLTRAARAA
jgi:nucleotide-binding universal stress UspA family protein